MEVAIPEQKYFRIGEVSKILGVESYVVRYWESEFKTVKPVRTESGQRVYKKIDIEELLTIKTLLYEDMFTIAGAKKKLFNIKKESKEHHEASIPRLVDIKKGLQKIKDIVG